jgi:peptidyl-prolyl cis-trans isomerase SurA
MNKMCKLLVVSVILFGSGLLSGQNVVDAIVAIVNDDIITLSDFRAEHDMIYEALRSQLQGEEFTKQYEAQKAALLDKMITERLLLQEARKKDLNVDEQLKAFIENIKTQYSLGSDEEFRRALAQQGIDYEAWRSQQENVLLQQTVVYAEVGRDIAIDETDVINYYDLHPEEFTEPEEYKLRGIILLKEGKSQEEIQLKKREIDERLAAGEDLAALAGEYSDGPQKESQGDMGTFQRGHLAAGLQEAVENLGEGEMTPWIEMPNGWYLIKLEEKKESRLKPFEEVKKEIENKLFNQEQQVKVEQYLKDLRDRSYIKILIPDPLNYR